MTTPMDKLMDAVDWKPTDAADCGEGLPYATHEGVMEILGHKLRCYRLSDGRAIFHADDVRSMFGGVL